MLLIFQIDKIDHNDAADIAQTHLSGDLLGSFHIVGEVIIILLFLFGIVATVDINDRQCLRRLNDKVATGRKIDLLGKRLGQHLLYAVKLFEGIGRICIQAYRYALGISFF